MLVMAHAQSRHVALRYFAARTRHSGESVVGVDASGHRCWELAGGPSCRRLWAGPGSGAVEGGAAAALVFERAQQEQADDGVDNADEELHADLADHGGRRGTACEAAG